MAALPRNRARPWHNRLRKCRQDGSPWTRARPKSLPGKSGATPLPATGLLDLRVTLRGLGAEPVGLDYLSGSQKFRVAVSLALAIGQFAGGHAWPPAAGGLDEGFACLDR